MRTKTIIFILVIFILISSISSLLGSYFMQMNSCSNEYQCIDNTNKCVDIPIYNIRDTNGKCVLICNSEMRCISNNQCIEIPKDNERDKNGNCRKKINISGNVITQSATIKTGNASVQSATK